MKLTHRIMAILMDGKPHRIIDITEKCKDLISPEACVRNFMRKNGDKNNFSYEYKARQGLRLNLLEVFRQLQDKGELVKNEEEVSLTEKGFIGCVLSVNRSDKVFKQLKLLLKTGQYFVELKLRG